MAPALNLRKKYRSIQSSALGSIFIQGGYVFMEGGNLIGQAPVWGPDLFLRNGQPVSPYQEVLGYARQHPYQKPVEETSEPEIEPLVKVATPLDTIKAEDLTEDIEDALSGPLEEMEPMPEVGVKRPRGRPRKDSGPGHSSGPN